MDVLTSFSMAFRSYQDAGRVITRKKKKYQDAGRVITTEKKRGEIFLLANLVTSIFTKLSLTA